ncbi:MAG TPA: ABC transporter, partial [Gammaproteobacteria bacterium]|nr:ABC transporter [Gammaproteobacteria bacterium]
GHQPHTVHIRLRAQIINVHTNSIVATKDFSAIEPMLQDNPYSGVTATNKATAVLLKQLADFVMRTI